MNNCGDCKYFSSIKMISYNFTKKECRYNPPVLIVVGITPKTEWPNVNEDDWCGRFEHNNE